jgi:hypothetical protein
MGLGHSPSIVRDELVLYLDAANPKSYPGSGTTWFDLSGKGNHFTLFNTPTFNGTHFNFNGSNEYARSTLTLNLSSYSSITVEVCFKDNNPALRGPMIFEHSSDWNSNTSGFGLFINSNGSAFVSGTHHTNHNQGSSAVNYSGQTGTNIVVHTNIWSRVVDSTGRLSYINGTNRTFSLGNTSTNSYSTFRNDNFFIASRGGISLFKDCNIYYIKVYGKKISQPENTKNFNATRGRFGI